MDLIRCFVTVADARSFTAAAKRLCRSQSAVSTRIQRLEQMLDVELLQRSSRLVELTAAGEQFLHHANGLLRLNDEAIGSVGRNRLRGQLRLGVVEYLAPPRLPELLSRIRRLLPGVDLSVRVAMSGVLLQEFDTGDLDIALVMEQEGRGSPQSFSEEKLVWVSSQHMAAPSGLTDLCLLPAPCAFRTAAVSALNTRGHPWREAVSLSGVLGVQGCVRQGLGVSVLCESALDDGLICLPQGSMAWPELPSMRLVTYERSSSPISRELLGLLKNSGSSLLDRCTNIPVAEG